MKTRLQKKETVKNLKDKLSKSDIVVFSTFARAGEKGLSVAQMSELKKLVKQIGAEYFIAKKTLINVALKEFKKEGVNVYSMDGSMGLTFSDGDSYAIAKKLYEFAKKNPALRFFGALYENNFLNKENFLEMAKMPSRETLIARLLGMMKYPISGLAIKINEISKKKATV